MIKPKIFVSYPKNPNLKNYITSLNSSGFVTELDNFAECDGLILVGGGDLSPCLYKKPNKLSKNVDLDRDIFELFLVHKFHSKNKPILGICRGIQVLNVYFGGTLKQDVKNHSSNLGDDLYHAVSCKRFMQKLYGEKTIVNSNHHQTIESLGKGLLVCALSVDGEIEAIEKNNVIACQFHPERMNDFSLLGNKIFDYFRSFFN